MKTVIANGAPTAAHFPCSLEGFLRQIGMLPRSVVVELNGEAVAPSEFADRQLVPGDRLGSLLCSSCPLCRMAL